MVEVFCEQEQSASISIYENLGLVLQSFAAVVCQSRHSPDLCQVVVFPDMIVLVKRLRYMSGRSSTTASLLETSTSEANSNESQLRGRGQRNPAMPPPQRMRWCLTSSQVTSIASSNVMMTLLFAGEGLVRALMDSHSIEMTWPSIDRFGGII
jgi:hypothetical protein